MLSRHAENLFWAGRHLERAEDTARILNVTYHSLLESPYADSAQTWRDVLRVLHALKSFDATGHEPDARTITGYLVTNHENPGSVIRSISQARENARSVRESIPTEVWEAINDFHYELHGRDLTADIENQPSQLYAMIRRRCQAVSGVAAETMPRTDGWRFLVSGWMLERAEMTCRLLNVRYYQLASADRPPDFHDWVAVLKSASAFEAFRKAYRGSMKVSDVVEFLLLSRSFPRSVLFCLEAAEHELIRLESNDTISQPLRLIGRLRANLQFQAAAELVEGDLHHFLDRVEEGAMEVTRSVSERFFSHAAEGALHRLGPAAR